MTALDIDALRNLAEEALADDERATPGPWGTTALVDHDGDDCLVGRPDPDRDNVFDQVADCYESSRPGADAAFIAAARSREPHLARAALALAELWPALAEWVTAGDVRMSECKDSSTEATARYYEADDALRAAFRRIRDGHV